MVNWREREKKESSRSDFGKTKWRAVCQCPSCRRRWVSGACVATAGKTECPTCSFLSPSCRRPSVWLLMWLKYSPLPCSSLIPRSRIYSFSSCWIPLILLLSHSSAFVHLSTLSTHFSLQISTSLSHSGIYVSFSYLFLLSSSICLPVGVAKVMLSTKLSTHSLLTYLLVYAGWSPRVSLLSTLSSVCRLMWLAYPV